MNLQITSEWFSAWATLAGAVGTVFAAWFAAIQLRVTRKNSDDQSRPYVYARLAPGIWGIRSYDLIVQNHGTSMARHVNVTSSENPLEVDGEANPFMKEALAKFLSDGSTFDLPPGAFRRIGWRMGSENENDPVLGMPEGDTPIRIQYKGMNDKRTFEETMVISPADYGALLPMPPEGPKPVNGKYEFKHLIRRLELISRAIERNHIE